MTVCKLFHPHIDQADMATAKTLLHTKVTSTRICRFVNAVSHFVDYGECLTSHLEMNAYPKHVRNTEQQVARSI